MANLQLEAVKNTNAYRFLQDNATINSNNNDYDYNPYADELYNVDIDNYNYNRLR